MERVETSIFNDESKYCTGHIKDMSPELVSIYNRTLKPFAHIGDMSDVENSKDYMVNPSCVGFIGKDDNLLDVYNGDRVTLESLKITYKQITDKLRFIVCKYCQLIDLIYKDETVGIDNREKVRSLNLDPHIPVRNGHPYGEKGYTKLGANTDARLIDNTYLVTRSSSWGYQNCPFRSPKDKNGILFGRALTGGGDDYWVYDLNTKESLEFNDLHIHMIEEHGFFEGSVPYRLDPIKVINFFQIKPNIDYSPKYRLFLEWKSEPVCGRYIDLKVGSKDEFEIVHIQQYEPFDAPIIERAISYPSDLPNVSSIRLNVKEIKDVKDSKGRYKIDIMVDGYRLSRRIEPRVPEEGFIFNLKYGREIIP